MQRTCRKCGVEFQIPTEDLEYYHKISPKFDGKVFEVPPPSCCPDCRQKRRLSFRNERSLYHRKCDFSGKQIISIYRPNSPYKVYSQESWWSDEFDALEFGQEYDFGRTFTEQFKDLQLKVPRLALYQKNAENSPYTNHTENLKNCYLCVDTADSREICFSKWIIGCRDLTDCYQMEKSELCYESLYSVGSYNCVYIYLSDNCRDSAFLYDCTGCNNCFLCSNLRHKSYFIANKQYSKEDYEKIIKEASLGSREQFEKFKTKYWEMLKDQTVYRDQVLIQCENCSLDFIYQCKNVRDSYDVIDSEDCRYCYDAGFSKDCYDAYEQGFDCERQYECHACNRGKFIMGCSVCYDTADSFYCEMCHNSRNLFGCVGLRHKQYCVFNKQYSKEEYEKLVGKIIEKISETGEWGEFLNESLSCFDYEETVANEYFPKVAKKIEEKVYQGPKFEIPDNIRDVEDNICEKVLLCEVSRKAYKIIQLELDFYRKMKLPIPRKCPDQRHLERMSLRNPRRQWQRNCEKCAVKIFTSFAPDRPEKVYCEKCYQAVVS